MPKPSKNALEKRIASDQWDQTLHSHIIANMIHDDEGIKSVNSLYADWKHIVRQAEAFDQKMKGSAPSLNIYREKLNAYDNVMIGLTGYSFKSIEEHILESFGDGTIEGKDHVIRYE